MKQNRKKWVRVFFASVIVFTAVILVRLGVAHWQVRQTASATTWADTTELGSTTSLTILPLYEEASVDESFQSGHGVSYLIRTDEMTILLDLGHNPEQVAWAPFLSNMQQAGLSTETIDMVFVSHLHPDHIGGIRPQPTNFSGMNVEAIFAPSAMDIGGQPAQVAVEPQVLGAGVAALGRMPFVQPFPFWLWQPLQYEQVLAVNVAGKGIVLITGCGHPTLERIVLQAEALFSEPVVGVVGGLHYEGLTRDELSPNIQFLAERNPQLVALSPHDSGTTALTAFEEHFSAAYRSIRVGEAIQFDAAAAASLPKERSQ